MNLEDNKEDSLSVHLGIFALLGTQGTGHLKAKRKDALKHADTEREVWWI